MNITYLRLLNDELRQKTIDALKQLDHSETFAPYVEAYSRTLAQCERMDAELDELEKQVDSEQL